MRPRMAADLRYTTSDVDYLFTYFTKPELDRKRKDDLHLRLVNPTRNELYESIDSARKWLGQFRGHPDWDGGAIHFNFAGHGCEDLGSIVLKDGLFSPTEFIDSCCEIASEVSAPGRLRISVVLDSCHSGFWPIEILDRSFNSDTALIVPFNLFASCMPDEYSLEDSSLGHGLFTYCLSTKSTVLGSFAATGVQINGYQLKAKNLMRIRF